MILFDFSFLRLILIGNYNSTKNIRFLVFGNIITIFLLLILIIKMSGNNLYIFNIFINLDLEVNLFFIIFYKNYILILLLYA